MGSPKIHHVIYSSSGEMNAILARVLGHLKIAEKTGWITFVDMERNRNYYSELEEIFSSRPRKKHRYLLELANIVENHLLSRCGGLVSGYSGMSEMAQVLSGDLEIADEIWDGRVPQRPKFLAKHTSSYRGGVPRI